MAAELIDLAPLDGEMEKPRPSSRRRRWRWGKQDSNVVPGIEMQDVEEESRFTRKFRRWKRRFVLTQPTDTDSISLADGVDTAAPIATVASTAGFTHVTSFDELSVLSKVQLPHGLVSFYKEYEYEQQGRPYVRVSHDTPVEEITRLLEAEWKMSVPSIVLEVISSVNKPSFWADHHQWDNLQEGIIAAASKTDMWIITHGFNSGIAKILGNAARKEQEHRESQTCRRHPKQSGPKLQPLTLIGIVRNDFLIYDEILNGEPRIEIENEGNRPQENKFELNPDHTHFVIVKDETGEENGMQLFLQRLARLLKNAVDIDGGCGIPTHKTDAGNTEKPSLSLSDIPLIGLLVGGGYRSIQMVLDHMKNQIPVVVVRGSGGAADLLYFAYDEVKTKARAVWDPDYLHTFIMSELSKKISMHFEEYRENNLARNKFRDCVLECVRHSHKEDRVFLSFLDVHSHKVDLSVLNQYLLKALFKSEKRGSDDYNWYHHIQKELYLTIDWNCPHIAQSEVFAREESKIRIEKKVFEQALMRENRESFIDMFLEQGFQLHKYLNEKRLSRLFERAENPEFFRTVCLEGALGYSFSVKLDKQFLKRDLNWLIEYLTRVENFVDVHELTTNCFGTYTMEPPVAERKAHHALVMWAVFMNRVKLAKILWKRSDYPIHLALMISVLYKKLVAYVKEKHVAKEMEENSKAFADMAVGILDRSFQNSNCRAFEILSEEVDDWNKKTTVEVAAMARNRKFIAHPCCQKWLTYLFYGDIRIRELKFGAFTIPPWIKIISSAFLLLPMYFWIHFRMGQKRSIMGIYEDVESEKESDADSDDDTSSKPTLSRMCSKESGRSNVVFPLNVMGGGSSQVNGNAHNGKVEWMELYEGLPSSVAPEIPGKKVWKTLQNLPHITFLQYLKPRPQPRIWKKIYLMWNAPVTKFWTHQIFYIIYLGLFSITVLWPSCGNFYLDASVWLWTFLIHLENIMVTCLQFKKYSSIPLATRTIELLFISIFLILFLVARIQDPAHLNLEFLDLNISPYAGRVIMCCGLLYFFYRFIWIYFPISPTLGPLLFRIRLMVTEDFVHFLRLALLVIISSGIAIHSVIYPDYPFNKELLRRVFHKAWFTLFITPIGDLEEDTKCERNQYSAKSNDNETEEQEECTIGTYRDFSCPNTGPWPYFMTIQYHVILKLILLTLLFALFSDTAAKTSSDADAIWRYQRYHLVLDFRTRYRLPPPLNCISFFMSFIKFVYRCVTCYFCKQKPLNKDSSESSKSLRLKTNEGNYWRSLAAAYLQKQEEEEAEKDLGNKQMKSIKAISDDVEYQKRSMNKLKVHITELEKMLLGSKIALEEIKHIVNKEDVRLTAGAVHLLSRHSPYPLTRVHRFLLADKYVPWEVLYSTYDPVVYSRPRTEYTTVIRDSVDEDLLRMREQQGHFFHPPEMKWNFAFTSGAGITIDRRTWLTKDDGSSVIYKLDSTGLPVNPRGRTGLRGRGCLFRWGPNHAIHVIITRWRVADSFMRSVPSVAEEHRLLEFIGCKDEDLQLLCLPGGFVIDDVDLYDIIRKKFAPRRNEKWSSEAMDKYFADFARAPAGDFVDVVGQDAQPTSMQTTLLLRGYLDDPRNTDNAWVEAEIWHFHYTEAKSFDIKDLPKMKWKKFTSNVHAKMLSSHAALLTEVQQRLESLA